MKKVLLLILLASVFSNTSAQDNIFVLVDVSRSVYSSELQAAKQLTKDLLANRSTNNSLFLETGTSQPINIQSGGKLMIMPFGDKSTVMNYNPIIENVDLGNVESIIEQRFRTNATDGRTYLSLAKARCPEIALTHSINEYIMILVSDETEDRFDGSNTGYSHSEQELVNKYRTLVDESAGAVYVFRSRNAFTVTVMKISLNRYTPSTPSTPSSSTTQNSPKIELTSLAGGTSASPIIVKENKFSISWRCLNCPKNIQYKIRLSPINNPSQKVASFTSTGNNYSFNNVGNGKWRITVYATNTQATTNIEVKAGSSYWFLWLMLFVVLAGAGYWYWKKIQEDKLKKLNSMSNNDSFSSGSTLNTNSDNSGYF
jgi:hypothetical protein